MLNDSPLRTRLQKESKFTQQVLREASVWGPGKVEMIEGTMAPTLFARQTFVVGGGVVRVGFTWFGNKFGREIALQILDDVEHETRFIGNLTKAGFIVCCTSIIADINRLVAESEDALKIFGTPEFSQALDQANELQATTTLRDIAYSRGHK